MFKKILIKIKESSFSILPVYLLILFFSLVKLVDLSLSEVILLTISTIIMIVGMAFFSLGADLAMSPMGKEIGTGLTKQGKLLVLLIVVFIFGMLITIAEPALSVMAKQVQDSINTTALLISIGVGTGLFLLFSVIKTVFRISLRSMLFYFYMVLFALCIIVVLTGNEKIIALAFDSGGVTTGAITVPFIMALGAGMSSIVSKKSDKDASFGFIGMCSIGPIIAVFLLGMFQNKDLTYNSNTVTETNYFILYLKNLLTSFKDVGIPLLLIIIFFLISDLIWLKLKKNRIYQFAIGILFAFFGLSLFLSSATTAFMPIGTKIGASLALKSKYIVVIVAFLIGALTVLAEPAIHVLIKQIEDITGGLVKKNSMLIALSVGVGTSIALSIIRIMFNFSILYYLIPIYIIALGLTFFVPKIYVAIAFDSGGVASGALTSSFIMPLAIGFGMVYSGADSIFLTAFGVVAMVASTPIITIEIVGLFSIVKDKIRIKKAVKEIIRAGDEEIIEFM